MKTAERQFTTISGVPIEPLYSADDLAGVDLARELPPPGERPHTRGIHRDMYRGKFWIMCRIFGLASAETNHRYRAQLAQGQTELYAAFDLPTLMGKGAATLSGQGILSAASLWLT